MRIVEKHRLQDAVKSFTGLVSYFFRFFFASLTPFLVVYAGCKHQFYIKDEIKVLKASQR